MYRLQSSLKVLTVRVYYTEYSALWMTAKCRSFSVCSVRLLRWQSQIDNKNTMLIFIIIISFFFFWHKCVNWFLLSCAWKSPTYSLTPNRPLSCLFTNQSFRQFSRPSSSFTSDNKEREPIYIYIYIYLIYGFNATFANGSERTSTNWSSLCLHNKTLGV